MSGLKREDLGAHTRYVSPGKPVGGHSIDLVESGLITSSSRVLSFLAFSLLSRGYKPPGLYVAT